MFGRRVLMLPIFCGEPQLLVSTHSHKMVIRCKHEVSQQYSVVQLAASNSHHTAEVISLGLTQFLKQHETHHKFWKAEKIIPEANARFGKTIGERRDLRYVHEAYRHILSCSVSSLQQKEKLFSVIFSRSDHTPPSSQLANFISYSLQEGKLRYSYQSYRLGSKQASLMRCSQSLESSFISVERKPICLLFPFTGWFDHALEG